MIKNIFFTIVFHQLKRQLLQECESIKDHKLVTDKITVVFCGKDVEPGTATESYLPVILHGCPPNFSTVQFFEVELHLKHFCINKMHLNIFLDFGYRARRTFGDICRCLNQFQEHFG